MKVYLRAFMKMLNLSKVLRKETGLHWMSGLWRDFRV